MKSSKTYSQFSIQGIIVLIFFWICLLVNTASAQFNSQQEKGIDLIVLLDRSGSMKINDEDELAVPAVKAILQEMSFLQGKNRVLIIPFGTNISFIPKKEKVNDGDFSNEFEKVSQGLDQFNQLNPVQVGAYTDLEMALIKAKQKFITTSSSESQKHIIIITDGLPYPGPDGRYNKLLPNERIKKSRDNILKLVSGFPQKQIQLTIFGLFKKSEKDYNQAIDYINKIQSLCNSNFIEIENSEEIVSSVIQFFPKSEDIIELYSGEWEKNIHISKLYRIQEFQAYIVMGRNQVKKFKLETQYGSIKTVIDKRKNIAFVSFRSDESEINLPKKLGFTPKIFVKGRTRLKINLLIEPLRNTYSALDNVKYKLSVIDTDSDDKISFTDIKANFKSPGYSKPIYFQGESDSAQFTIPEDAANTTAVLNFDVSLDPNVKISKKLYWPIKEIIEGDFIIEPELPIINFGELGNQRSSTVSLKKHRLKMSSTNLKTIRPQIKFEFDEGLFADDWFPTKYNLPRIKPSSKGIQLPDISIIVPSVLEPEFENKKYTGSMIVSAKNVSELIVPFSFVFKRPHWSMDYKFINNETGVDNEKKPVRFLNLFNLLFKDMSINFSHNSGYEQSVSALLDSSLQINGNYMETSRLKLAADSPGKINIFPDQSGSYKFKIEQTTDDLPNGYYKSQIVVSGDRLPAITIPLSFLIYKRYLPFLFFAVIILGIFIYLVRNKAKWQTLLDINRRTELRLPCQLTSDLSNTTNEWFRIADKDIRVRDIEFTMDQDGYPRLINNSGRNDVTIIRYGERIQVSGSEEIEEQDQIEILNRGGKRLACTINNIENDDINNPNSIRLNCTFSNNLADRMPTFWARILWQIIIPLILILIADFFIGSFSNISKEVLLASSFYLAIFSYMFSLRKPGNVLMVIFLLSLIVTSIF